jgi:hypothetical protein
MKFIVTNPPYSNEYTVTVAPESKRRIAKVLYWTPIIVGGSWLAGTYVGEAINKKNAQSQD